MLMIRAEQRTDGLRAEASRSADCRKRKKTAPLGTEGCGDERGRDATTNSQAPTSAAAVRRL